MQVILPRLQSWGELYPNQLDGLALWLDAIDQNSLLASDGSVIEDGEAVALWSDKSGNSAENALLLNGATGNYASTPDSAALDITGDIDIRVRCALVDWTPAAVNTLIGKYTGVSDQRGYLFDVNTTGSLRLIWSTDGTSGTIQTAESTAASGFSDFSTKWVRVTLDVDNGASGYDVKFYTSDDGINWSQLGDTVVGGAPTSIFNSSQTLQVGAQNSGASNIAAGQIYRAIVKSGIDGTTVFDADFTAQSKLATSFTESSSNAATVTINTTGATGARISGARDLYQGTVANRPVFLKYNGEKYGYFNGVVGNNARTPDSPETSITGDIDITAKLACPSWISGGTIVAKDNGNTQRSYAFGISAANPGQLYFGYSLNGTSATFVFSTVATGFAAYSTHWVRATRDSSTGDIDFYTSSDGENWTQLGTTVSSTSGSIADTTAELSVGQNSGGAGNLDAKIYNVSVYSGIAGTLAAKFDAQDYNSGSTFVSSATGETWTLNGGSHIVQRTGLYFDGSNDYLKSASFSLSQPENDYIIGSLVTWTSGDTLRGGVSTGFGTYQTGASPGLQIYAGTGVAANNTLELKTDGIITSIFNEASSSLRINRGTASTGNPGASNSNGITLCASDVPAAYANAFIHEVLIYDTTAQSTATQDRVALYAGKKWKFAV